MQDKRSTAPEARQALKSFKEEIAKELGLENETEAGYIGSHTVERMIERAKRSLTDLGRS
ncbi:MAG TPA: alpha/beta-type small acid-soluble spore protein [Oscillospiraceae bacterium]|nr:alpha/beta-type small acid-soluble spore protein [Oscillospiraceae bacterium]